MKNKFFILLIIIPFLIKTAIAQIVYTDITPDTTIIDTVAGISYNLDINNDGIFDFSFSIIQYGGGCGQYTVELHPVNVSDSVIMGYSYNFVSYLAYNSIIDNSVSWGSGGMLACLCGNTCDTAGWPLTIPYFAGLKFKSGGNTYYGWCKADVFVVIGILGGNHCTIYDYAYNSIPGQPILAGDTGIGASSIVNNNFHSSFSVSSFNKNIYVQLNDNVFSGGVINIFNNIGQLIKKENISTILTEINMNECSSGIYFVVIRTNNSVLSKKIYLK